MNRRSSQPVLYLRDAFTLVELVVVVVIVLILLGIALPAASTIWAQRKVAEAENTLQGVLNNARARAVSAGGVETGLFFYLDANGVQHIAPIEQDDPGDILRQHVFRFSGDRDETLPAPMRVLPRYAVEPSNQAQPWKTFESFELLNDMLEPNLGNNIQVGQRHRNFFTLIYARDGQLRVARDVLLVDPSTDTLGRDVYGDRTGLFVGMLPDQDTARYYRHDNTQAMIDPTGAQRRVKHLIQAPQTNIAINFPSVDGLLLYNDQEFRAQGADPLDNTNILRRFLIRNAQPFYISRLTGEVIRGPVGEGAT